jgi:hypothetical protein
MHLAGKAVDAVIARNPNVVADRLGWTTSNFRQETERLISIARLAGLLHDVGHSPFSHTGEQKLFPQGIKHEHYSAAIIRDTEIGDIVDGACKELGFDKDTVASVVAGEFLEPAGFVQEIISSRWDVDKMDYLLRDSYYCGVQYGTFDLNRILNTLTLDTGTQDPGLRLAIEEGGQLALEAFVLARYYMFNQVYFHDVRRAFDLVLTDFMKELLSELEGQPTYPPPGELEKYFKWDDFRVISAASDRKSEELRNPAWRVADRQHPKVVFETPPVPDAGLVRKAQQQLMPGAEKEFPGTKFWLDRAIDHPERFRWDEPPLMIKFTGPPEDWRTFRGQAHALRGLEEVHLVRLYADVRGNNGLEEQVRRFCRQFMA